MNKEKIKKWKSHINYYQSEILRFYSEIEKEFGGESDTLFDWAINDIGELDDILENVVDIDDFNIDMDSFDLLQLEAKEIRGKSDYKYID